MKILVGCELTGAVRDAFRTRGHDAWSCDLLGPEEYPHIFAKQQFPSFHLKGDLRDYLSQSWDMLIVHPPCTHLASSGARWFREKPKHLQKEALDFVRMLMELPISRICIENPVGVISTKIRKPDQIIQPWQFGHPVTKTTCLWLKRLPYLRPTNITVGRNDTIKRVADKKDRWLIRAKTYRGIAEAMAEQWGDLSNYKEPTVLKL